MDLIKVNPEEYQIPESRAKEVSAMFKPMLEMMEKLETEYNEVVNLPITPETCKRAKEVRLKYVKVRTETARIHKEAKDFFLKGGKFVDGWKNAQLAASCGYEENLKSIEEHFERIEQEKIKKIADERTELLRQCEYENFPPNIGEMETDVWEHYFSAVKKSYDDRKEAERKAEQERIENQKKDENFRERSLKLAKYSQFDIVSTLTRDTTDEQYNLILTEAEKLHSDFLKKQEETRLENEKLKKEKEEREAAERKEREAREEAERKQKAENDRKLQEEKEKREKAEQELQAQREAEAQRLKDEENARQAELQKGDAEKIKDLVNELELLKTKYQFNANIYIDAYEHVKTGIDNILEYFKDK